MQISDEYLKKEVIEKYLMNHDVQKNEMLLQQ